MTLEKDGRRVAPANGFALSKSRWMLTASSMVLLLGASTAAAQEASSGQVEQVVVSSTRLQSAGFDAPTPTTVIGVAAIEKDAQPNVFNTIVELPALQGSTGTTYETGSTSTGLNGISALSLRGLSPLRTLTLLDGQRVVGSNFNGVVDVSLMPQLLLQRVDVVTGGASASWGSDAIAGVVNFVTDKHFTGIKANLQGGISTYGDDAGGTAQFAAGEDILGGRGHIEAAAEYMYSPGIQPTGHPADTGYDSHGINGRNFNQFTGIQMRSIAATPAGSPEYTFGAPAQNYQYTKYGLITAGPLQGIAFGVNGAPYNFNYAGGGTPSHSSSGAVNGCVSPTCFGTATDPGDLSSFQSGQTLQSALTRGDFYTRMSYNLTPDTEIYGTVNYGISRGMSHPNPGPYKNANLTIQCGNAPGGPNAFLPGSINQACITNNMTSFQFGTESAAFPNYEQINAYHAQRRYVLGADGVWNLFGKDWSWDTYFEHGESDTSIHIKNMSLTPRYNAALDAVAGPNGTIVCRSTVAQAAGCAPLDMLGDVPISPEALAYVEPENGPYSITSQRQEAFSASISGSPFSNWAGPVAVATGVEYREEAFNTYDDPYGNGVTASNPNTTAYPVDPVTGTGGNNWYAGNFHDGHGNYHETEGFVEVGVPLINNSTWGKADLDVAGRMTGYNTSGQVMTWKVGATWDTPVPGIRLRALQSRDVRAPNLSELFAPSSVINSTVKDDFLPGAPAVSVQQVNAGNLALKPEKSQTTELGMVYQPDWLPGFNASVDYYRIAVKDVIAALSIQNVVDLCYYGNQAYCAGNVIVTSNGGPAATSTFKQVVSQVFNLASQTTDGFDIEASYQFDLQDWNIPGAFSWRALVNHTSKFITDPGVPGQPVAETAGALANFSTSTTYNATGGTTPLWKADMVEDYTADWGSFTLTERWFSDGVFNKSYIQCSVGSCPLPTVANPTINYNHMDGAFYLDVGASYNLSDTTTLYGKVDNVANLPPATSSSGVNVTLYDVVGRYYHLGVRLKM
jgi:iron complex outermembrane receptor protein